MSQIFNFDNVLDSHSLPIGTERNATPSQFHPKKFIIRIVVYSYFNRVDLLKLSEFTLLYWDRTVNQIIFAVSGREHLFRDKPRIIHCFANCFANNLLFKYYFPANIKIYLFYSSFLLTTALQTVAGPLTMQCWTKLSMTVLPSCKSTRSWCCAPGNREGPGLPKWVSAKGWHWTM